MINKLKDKKEFCIFDLCAEILSSRYLHDKRLENSCRSSSTTNLSHPRVREMLQVSPSSIVKVCGQFYDRDKFPLTWHSRRNDEARMDAKIAIS